MKSISDKLTAVIEDIIIKMCIKWNVLLEKIMTGQQHEIHKCYVSH